MPGIDNLQVGVLLLQGATVASNSLLLKASTKVGSVGFSSPHQMQRFLNAAISECAVDTSFVLACLGSQDTEGHRRLRELCTCPFSIQVRGTFSTT